MSAPSPAAAARRLAAPPVLGALGVLVVAAVLYSRFDLYGKMIRDSSIYIYGGQQLLHGRPPYVSEMDPKGPLSSILSGIGVAVARMFGRNDILAVRIEFCAIAVIGVLGLYLLVLELTRSVVAAVVAAVVFASFKNFGYNAFVQTDGHVPGIVCVIFALWLTVRKQWYLAGVLASLAFLTWQPLFAFPLLGLVCALVWSPGQRRRALLRNVLGLATPFVVLVVYYAVDGHLTRFIQGLLIFPLTGVERPPESATDRFAAFVRALPNLYGNVVILFWVGIALMLASAVWTVASARSRRREMLLSPIVLLFTLSFVLQIAYVFYDYIGYPHTWPLLPYAALGIGLGTAKLLDALAGVPLRSVTAVLLAAAAALAVVSAVIYSQAMSTDGQLRAQQAGACALKRSLVPRTPLWVIDDPVPLVLMHRRNPDDFPFVGGGLDVFKVRHTPGGFLGWTRQIRHSRASIVVFDSWVNGKYKEPLQLWLRTHGYKPGYLGQWKVYVTAGARAQMADHSIALKRYRKTWPETTTGVDFTVTHCPGPTGQ